MSVASISIYEQSISIYVCANALGRTDSTFSLEKKNSDVIPTVLARADLFLTHSRVVSRVNIFTRAVHVRNKCTRALFARARYIYEYLSFFDACFIFVDKHRRVTLVFSKQPRNSAISRTVAA